MLCIEAKYDPLFKPSVKTDSSYVCLNAPKAILLLIFFFFVVVKITATHSLYVNEPKTILFETICSKKNNEKKRHLYIHKQRLSFFETIVSKTRPLYVDINDHGPPLFKTSQQQQNSPYVHVNEPKTTSLFRLPLKIK